jgi:Mg2+ and Co2+ transporter CorA
MKTLSLLGALFLPGTYLASVFGMSFFNYEAGEFGYPPFSLCLSYAS